MRVDFWRDGDTANQMANFYPWKDNDTYFPFRLRTDTRTWFTHGHSRSLSDIEHDFLASEWDRHIGKLVLA